MIGYQPGRQLGPFGVFASGRAQRISKTGPRQRSDDLGSNFGVKGLRHDSEAPAGGPLPTARIPHASVERDGCACATSRVSPHSHFGVQPRLAATAVHEAGEQPLAHAVGRPNARLQPRLKALVNVVFDNRRPHCGADDLSTMRTEPCEAG